MASQQRSMNEHGASPPSSSHAQLGGLFELQRRRCQAHTQWATAFDGLLRGALRVATFDAMVHPIVTEMQSVSAAMRAARDGGNGDADTTTSTKAVRAWVAALQEHERALYEATVLGQQVVVKHLLAPLSPSVSASAAVAATGGVSEGGADGAAVPPRDPRCTTQQHCWDCAVANLATVRRAASSSGDEAPSDAIPPIVALKHLSLVDGGNTLDDDDDGGEEEGHGEGDGAAALHRVGIARSCAAASAAWTAARKARLEAQRLIADLMDEAAELLMDAQ